MISCDTIIENGSLYLRNLNTRATSKDVWITTPTGQYNTYTVTYEKNLMKNHIYYYRCGYKYTTTNQSPTWVTIYSQSGYVTSSATIKNPVAGQEYTLSGYAWTNTESPTIQCVIYNGPSGSINGVTASIKNLLVYDITPLWDILMATQSIQWNVSALVTWCDENLEYMNSGVNYDITDLIEDLTKIVIRSGSLCCEAVECDGMQYYSAKTSYRNLTYFDTAFHPLAQIYNNTGNGNVVLSRVSAKEQDSPFYPEHQYVLKIQTNGTATPGAGGFLCQHTAAANKIFIERFVAKVPVGYYLSIHYNSQGNGSTVEFLTPNAGTGEWEEYAVLYKCGSSGSFSSGGYIAINANTGYSNTAVTWYLAYLNNCDITDNEELKNYTALPNKDVIKGNKVFSREFNTGNFIPNGTCTDSGMTLPTGWTYDDDDYAGSAKRSIVQPIGAASGMIFGDIKIASNTKYKLSFWVKCKGDMTSFRTVIYPYTSNGVLLDSKSVFFVPGTETTLTADLVSGATQMTVSSNANWVVQSYSGVGFRSWSQSYNNKGIFWNNHTGIVNGVTGNNVVTFKKEYTGDTISKGTYVVESYQGAEYIYPIMKDKLPTDNTWKYVEGYIGADSWWRGSNTYNSWIGFPAITSYIKIELNMDTNDGTVPIKFSDIKLVQVGTYGDGERNENKIQFKKHN